MKISIIILFLLLATKQASATVSKDEAVKLNVYMGFAISNYFCKNESWPEDLKALLKFENKNEVPYHKMDKLEWKYVLQNTLYINPLEGGGVGYSVDSNDLETEAVSSRHSKPDCNESVLEKRMMVEIILSV